MGVVTVLGGVRGGQRRPSVVAGTCGLCGRGVAAMTRRLAVPAAAGAVRCLARGVGDYRCGTATVHFLDIQTPGTVVVEDDIGEAVVIRRIVAN